MEAVLMEAILMEAFLMEALLMEAILMEAILMEAIPMCFHQEPLITKFPSNITILLQLEGQHVSTLLGHLQAFTVNQLNIKLPTFLGSQTVFTSDNYKQFSV